MKAVESKRLHELFKYFQAASHAIGLDNDIESEQHYNPNLAQLSLDPVLNALCQLGAHRLRCDRAFISLIDDANQFIISEMTQSVSLYETARHRPGDALCLGARPLDLETGVCAGTMPAFTSGTDAHHLSTSNVFADSTRYIINNFTLEPKYRDRPYVQNFPFMRWYAEVPIKSSSGYVIGTYALVDNKPRDGLEEDDYLALKDIADAIMKHLEKVKSQDDHAQASRLLQGLNSLVQGGQPTLDGADRNVQPRKRPLSSSDPTTDLGVNREASPTSATTEQNPSETSVQSWLSAIPTDSGAKAAKRIQTTIPAAAIGDTQSSEMLLEINIARSSINIQQSTDSGLHSSADIKTSKTSTLANVNRDFVVSDEIRSSLYNSAAVLRAAMDLDGVVFLDASPNSFLSHAERSVNETSASFSEDLESFLVRTTDEIDSEHEFSERPNGSTASGGTRPHGDERPGAYQLEPRESKILGYAAKSRNKAGAELSEHKQIGISELLHQSLLYRYPNGQIFNFHHEKPEETRKSLSSELRDFSYTGSKYTSASAPRTVVHKNHKILTALGIDREVHAAFPAAKSVIFVPLWTSPKDKGPKGCLVWSSREKRVLQPEDLSYCKIFGNSMMAKLTRLELVYTDQAKSDFISCISHELRSPLHGILGYAELLKEEIHDTDHQEMVDMVEMCGRTLLDNLTQILEYSKINTSTRHDQPLEIGFDELGTDSVQNSLSDKQCLFDLDVLVEETVESLVAGHQYSVRGIGIQTQKRNTELLSAKSGPVKPVSDAPKTLVMLNMDHTSWKIRSIPGSWRRCMVNILGNALKYTDSGFVEVRLHHQLQKGLSESTRLSKRQQSVVSLSVRDTGRGIGKTYLENHLFRPFVQENTLSVGTGLGLSIVKSLVDDLGGWVDVQSEVGVGSQVTISIPTTFVSDPTHSSISVIPGQKPLEVCVLGLDHHQVDPSLTNHLPVAGNGRLSLKYTLADHFRHWLGATVVSAPNIEEAKADIIVVDEENLNMYQTRLDDQNLLTRIPAGSLLIVLCTKHGIQDRSEHLNLERVYFLAQPFGPRRLAALVTKALRVRDAIQPPQPANPSKLSAEERAGITMKQTTNLTAVSQHAEEIAQEQTLSHNPFAPSTELRPTPRLRVLLVDDNEINLSLLVRCMSRLQITYETACNGLEAFEAFKASPIPFDYVFMDISMPIMDGFAASRAIRDYELTTRSRKTQIVAMTGLGSVGAKQEAIASGMNLFLSKPVQMKKVQSLVQGGGADEKEKV